HRLLQRRAHARHRGGTNEPRRRCQGRRVQGEKRRALTRGVGRRLRRLLPVSRRYRRDRARRREGCNTARGQPARRGGGRRGRRAWTRHGVYRRPAFPALMKLLVVGSGGREHAIAWRLAQSPRVQKVFVAPGNGGTAREPGLENVALSEVEKLAEFA